MKNSVIVNKIDDRINIDMAVDDARKLKMILGIMSEDKIKSMLLNSTYDDISSRELFELSSWAYFGICDELGDRT